MGKHMKCLVLILICVLVFSSCGMKSSLFIKLGLRNDKFEYINEGNVKNVTIESVRDKKFKFIITDMNVLKELYEILSKGKEIEEKSSLTPDYIFKIQMKNKEIKEYYYVAGLDKENKGNFYNEDEKYIISSRLDNDLLKNFFNIRTPLRFKDVYYDSILGSIDMFREIDKYERVNVNIASDKDAAKFILSIEENNFKSELQSKYPNCILNDSGDKWDLEVKIKTVGYKSTIIKMVVDFRVDDDSIKQFYVVGKHKDKKWNIDISEDKPNNFKE